MSALQVLGVGRDVDDERTVCAYFNRKPTDDDLRGIHESLRLGDPADPRLPFDVKIGGMTLGAGVSLHQLIRRAQFLHEQAYGPAPSPEQQARNLALLQGSALLNEAYAALSAATRILDRIGEAAGNWGDLEVTRLRLQSSVVPLRELQPDGSITHVGPADC